MRKQNLEEVSCRLCEHATVLSGGEHCLCTRRGVVYSYGKCRKFRADLLKFSPDTRPVHLPEIQNSIQD